MVRGRRYRVNTDSPISRAGWDEAALFRDKYEEAKGIGQPGRYAGAMPTLTDFAKRYLDEDTSHLAPRTHRDRRGYLKADGTLMLHLGARRLDEITTPMLREWWSLEITGKGRSTGTGRHHVNTLSAIFGYAKDLGIVEESPVPAFREQLRRRARTKRGRAESTPGKRVRPIEEPAELGRLVAAARDEGLVPLVLVFLQLDAGLRLGEALGLRWGAIAWGEDENDRTRALLIDQSLPSHGEGLEETKSGRARKVGLSRRLRRALGDVYLERFQPSPHALILEGVEPNNFRAREWRRICKAARIGHRAMKDLRDTYASQLFSAGVQLGYVSRQLGHARPTVTADHYARWIEGDEYREPMALEPGEVPADLLARLSENCSQFAHTTHPGVNPAAEASPEVSVIPNERL